MDSTTRHSGPRLKSAAANTPQRRPLKSLGGRRCPADPKSDLGATTAGGCGQMSLCILSRCLILECRGGGRPPAGAGLLPVRVTLFKSMIQSCSARRIRAQVALGLIVGAAFAMPGRANVHAKILSPEPTPSPAASMFIRGDANDDGSITLADVIHVASYLYEAGPTPLPVPESGDADCDNTIGPRDVVYLINFILRGGPQPKCPT